MLCYRCLLFVFELLQLWFRLLSNYDGFTVPAFVCQAKSSCGCNVKIHQSGNRAAPQRSRLGHKKALWAPRNIADLRSWPNFKPRCCVLLQRSEEHSHGRSSSARHRVCRAHRGAKDNRNIFRSSSAHPMFPVFERWSEVRRGCT